MHDFGTASGSATPLPRYPLVQRLLHWLIAVLVLLALIAGGTIGLLGFEGLRSTFGPAGTDFLYTSHKTLGVLILGLMLMRLATRLLLRKPPYATPLPRWQRAASEAVHGTLYLLLLAMPVVGWLATAAGGFPVHFFNIELPGLVERNRALSETLFFWHRVLGILIVALVVAHVGAALYHWRVRRDGVMTRMSLLRR